MLRNYSTRDEKKTRIGEKTVITAVDIANREHCARMYDARGLEINRMLRFKNSREGFEKFERWIKKGLEKQGSQDMIVGMEATGHYYYVLEEYLETRGIEVVIVNSREVRGMSRMYGNDGSKNDPRDAQMIGELTSRGRYSVTTRPKTGNYAELRGLVELRDYLNEERTRLKNRLHRLLTQVFPEYKKIKKSGLSKGLLVIYKELGSLDNIEEAGAEGLYDILKKNRLSNLGRKTAEKIYRLSKTSIGIKRGLTSAGLEMRILVGKYQQNEKELKEIETAITDVLKEMEEAQLLLEIKGIGPIITAELLSEIGEINNYNSYKQLQKLAGYAIETNSSGEHTGRKKCSKMGRKRLKRTLYRAALVLISTNKEFKAIYTWYTRERAEPMIKMKAVVAIACKLIRVLFTMLKNKQRYNGEKMLEDRKTGNLKTA